MIFFSFVCIFETIDAKKPSSYKISNFEPITGNSEEIKYCYSKLDTCLSECNDKFPNRRIYDYQRGRCRDSCVQFVKETFGCLMYYRTSRK